MAVKRPLDFSVHFAHEALPARLRRLAAVAEEAGVEDQDVYGASPALQRFELEVAQLLGKPAAAFFATGTLAQRAALHAHAAKAGASGCRVIVHPTSHLVHHDCLRDAEAQAERARAEAAARLPGFAVELAGELRRVAALADFAAPSHGDAAAVATAAAAPAAAAAVELREGDVVVVELPQRMNGGRTMAWADLRQLAALADRAGARLHMDGARLWEVQPFYNRPLREICGLFHSVYVSFYKGLGGMSGAMLCGDADFLATARQWRERLGGSVFSSAPAWLDAQAQLRQCTQAGFGARFEKLKEVVQALSEDDSVRKVLRFEPPTPESCLIHGYVRGAAEDLEAIHERVASTTGCRLWNRLRGRGYQVDPLKNDEAAGEFYFEWNMGPANAALPTSTFLNAWKAFADTALPPPPADL